MVTVVEALTRPCAVSTSYAREGRNTVIRTDIAPKRGTHGTSSTATTSPYSVSNS